LNAFGPEKRLHYSWEYRRFFSADVSVSRLKECLVFRIPNEYAHFRLGISMKARGSSLERNRVKRAVRESFRTHQDHLGSFDYNVLIPASKRMDHTYAKRLRDTLNTSLAKGDKGWTFGPLQK